MRITTTYHLTSHEDPLGKADCYSGFGAQKRQAVGESNSTKTALPRQGSTLWWRVASAHLLEAAVQIRQLLLERGRPAGIK